MASPEGTTRQRVLVDLSLLAPEAQGFGAAAELAGLLDGDLVGVFVEDEALHGLASLPFARELRLPGHSWSPLDPARLVADLHEAAARAQSLLETQCARLGVPGRFELIRGDAAACVTGRTPGSDILVIGMPEGPAARQFGAFDRVWQAARCCAGPVLLLPRRIRRRRGPIALVLGSGDQERLRLAGRLARAARERLLLILPPGAGDTAEALARATAATSLGAEEMRIERLDASSPMRLHAMLDRWGERLLILDRGETVDPLGLAELRRVPVLLQ